MGSGDIQPVTPCARCGINTAEPEYPDGLILCGDCRERKEETEAYYLEEP